MALIEIFRAMIDPANADRFLEVRAEMPSPSCSSRCRSCRRLTSFVWRTACGSMS